MKTKLLLLFIFLLVIGGSASAQLVLTICSAQANCPGFPVGSVQAPIDQNGWRNFKVTLTQNVTSFSFQGIPPSPAQASVNIIFTQDATGGRTVTFASSITSSCTVTGTASATTLCQFEYDGVAAQWFSISGGGSTGASQTGTFNSSTNLTPTIFSITGGVSPCTPANEFTQIGQPGTVVDALDGIVCQPSGATNHQANGVAGYVNSNANSLTRTQANAVGVYGSGRCLGNNCAVWGMNSIAGDGAGITADNMESFEADLNLNGSPTYVAGFQLNGVSTSGAVFPANAAELDILYNGPVKWPYAIRVQPGVTVGTGLWLDGVASSSSQSTILRQTGYSGATAQNWNRAVDASGNLHVTGPGNYLHGTSVGSINPYTASAPTATALANAPFITNTTETSPAITWQPSGHSYFVGIQSGINGANSITSVTDTLGHTYQRISSQVTGSRDMEVWAAICPINVSNPATGTVTVNQGSSAALGFFVWDVNGINCTSPLGTTASAQVATGTSTTAAVTSFSTTSANEIVLSFAIMANSQTCTQGAGYTLDNGASASNMCAQHQVFGTAQTATTASSTFTSAQWWEMAISLQTLPQLGVPASPWGSVTASQYQSGTNCAVNSVSPAACGSAAAGAVVIPTTTTTYTINTTDVTPASRIFLQPMTWASNLPSAPTCVAPAAGFLGVSASTAGTSFTVTLPSTTGTVCLNYWIVN